MKMPFCITVDDVVYSLCIKALKNSLAWLKVTATITWFEKKDHRKVLTKQLTSSSCGRYYNRSLEKDILLIF